MDTLVLFDLNDTLRQAAPTAHPYELMPVPGAHALLDEVRNAGHRCAGIGNEASIALGRKTLEGVIAEEMLTLALFPALDLILFCPDFRGRTAMICTHQGARHASSQMPWTGTYRKPNTGMAWLAGHMLEAIPYAVVGTSKSTHAMADRLNLPFMHSAEALARPEQLAQIGRQQAVA